MPATTLMFACTVLLASVTAPTIVISHREPPKAHEYSISKTPIRIQLEMGEAPAPKGIKLDGMPLDQVRMQQSVETSVTIMNEGPHIDLTEWKHYRSAWKTLQVVDDRFIVAAIQKADSTKFPMVSMEELRAEVTNKGGKSWADLINKTTTPHEYPAGVAPSRLFVRIQQKSGARWRTVQMVVFLLQMGC